MKVTVKARQLTDANIEKVSLVQHGANRTPFQILKSAALPDGDTPAADVRKALDLRLNAHFGKSEDGPAKVTAVFVRKGTDLKVVEALREQGFVLKQENAAVSNDVLVFKQDGFDEENMGTMLALSDDVAVGLDRVVKGFESWHRGNSFDENLQAAGFYPGMHLGMEALSETIYQIMWDARSAEEAAPLIDAACKSFSKWIGGLVKVLPVTVFKADQVLSKEFGGSKKAPEAAASTAATDTSEGNDVTKTVKKTALSEAAAGDLAGLMDEPAPAEVVKADEAAAAAAATEETTAAAGEPAKEAPAADAAAAAADAGEAVVKLEDVVQVVGKMAEGLNAVIKAVGTIQTDIADLKKTGADTAEVAKAAAVVAAKTVVAGVDLAKLDEGLASLGGAREDVKKGHKPEAAAGNAGSVDVFKGVLPMIESFGHLNH